MSFARVFGHFPMWFHIFGQSSSLPSEQLLASSAKNYFQRVHSNGIKYIPVGVLLICTIFVTIVVCFYSSFWDKLTYTLSTSFSQVLNAQNLIILVVDSFTVLITVGQTIFLSPYYSQLFTQINIIENLSRKKIEWDLFGLRRLLIRRMFYVCAGYILPYISILLMKSPTMANLILLSCDFTLKTLTLISYFQVLFYIELFNHMLKTFVKHIEKRAATTAIPNVITIYSRDPNENLLKLEIYYFKLLHFNLWELSQTINNLFGWILFLYLLNYFLYSIYIFFHLCIFFLDITNHNEVIRKFVVIKNSLASVKFIFVIINS